MKPLITLRAVYNDKEVLKKLRKSIGEYALNCIVLTYYQSINCYY